MDLEECLLITDATLTHLAMGCPRLEKLVSDSLISMILYMIFLSKTVLAFACSSYSNCVYTMLYFLRAPLTTGMRMWYLLFPSAESVTLRTDHRRRPPANRAVAVRGGTPSRLGAGQLPEHLGQRSEPCDAGLSQSWAHWTLRLPTHYQRGHTQTQSIVPFYCIFHKDTCVTRKKQSGPRFPWIINVVFNVTRIFICVSRNYLWIIDRAKRFNCAKS